MLLNNKDTSGAVELEILNLDLKKENKLPVSLLDCSPSESHDQAFEMVSIFRFPLYFLEKGDGFDGIVADSRTAIFLVPCRNADSPHPFWTSAHEMFHMIEESLLYLAKLPEMKKELLNCLHTSHVAFAVKRKAFQMGYVQELDSDDLLKIENELLADINANVFCEPVFWVGLSKQIADPISLAKIKNCELLCLSGLITHSALGVAIDRAKWDATIEILVKFWGEFLQTVE